MLIAHAVTNFLSVYLSLGLPRRFSTGCESTGLLSFLVESSRYCDTSPTLRAMYDTTPCTGPWRA